MHLVMAAAIAAMLLLTYVWPFAISADPADPAFEVAAVAAFSVFLAALLALVCKALRISS